MKRKFALTMEFVEEYLKEVVNQPFPFGDKEKNKLTFEVLGISLSQQTFPWKKENHATHTNFKSGTIIYTYFIFILNLLLRLMGLEIWTC